MGKYPCCDKSSINKGSWSRDEDDKLRKSVLKHGNGFNWHKLAAQAGLNRCGKSCRLRWFNYLDPARNTEDFTEEEENIIVEMHAKLGNKWAMIAEKLRGRTGNDVKTHFTTKMRKKLKLLEDMENHILKPEPCSREDSDGVHYVRLEDEGFDPVESPSRRKCKPNSPLNQTQKNCQISAALSVGGCHSISNLPELEPALSVESASSGVTTAKVSTSQTRYNNVTETPCSSLEKKKDGDLRSVEPGAGIYMPELARVLSRMEENSFDANWWAALVTKSIHLPNSEIFIQNERSFASCSSPPAIPTTQT